MLKKILFSQVSPVIKLGQKKPIELKDIPDLPTLWDPSRYEKGFDHLNGSKGGKHLILQILLVLKPQAWRLSFLILLILAFKLSSPVLIHHLISAIGLTAKGELGLMTGISIALLLCFVQLLSSIISQHYIYHSVTSTQSAINGINQRICQAVLQSKSQSINKGQIINRASGDAEVAGASLWAMGELLQITLTAIGTAAVLIYYIGTAAIPPIFLLGGLIPVSRWFSSKFAFLQGEVMKNRDDRVSRMSQFLSGIKVIKSFVWERPVRSEISEIRKNEISSWNRLTNYKAFSTGIFMLASLSVTLLAFTIYVMQGNTLTPAKAFTCLMLFSYLEPCFRQLPKILGDVTSSFVAGDRISSLLSESETMNQKLTHNSDEIKLIDVTVDYPAQPAALKNISLTIRAGESIAVVGSVGSGKTTFLKTIMSEIHPSKGHVLKNRAMSTSYVPQDPFLFHGSLLSNISLGGEVNEIRLNEALFTSCLDHDLRSFPGRLETEILEGGGNLSGGQKQRVNLARAAFHAPELVLLDDPLSALDPFTEKEVVERLIFGQWKNKTRIMATHRLGSLKRFDRIVFLEKGEVVAVGSLDELMKRESFRLFMRDQEKESSDVPKKKEVETVSIKSEGATVKVSEEEEINTGEVALRLYKDYFKAMAGFSTKNYPKTFALLLGTALLAMLFPILQNSWLSRWTQSLSSGTTHLGFYLGIYAFIGFGTTIIGAFQHFIWSRMAVKAAEALHVNALEGILKTPLRFFDANPTGRILNRFSRDLDAIERDLSWSLEDAVMASLNSFGAVLVMIFALPFMALIVFPVLAVYWYLQKAYRTCMRETKRLQSQFRSPRISSIQEVLDGAAVIRCYKAEAFFSDRFTRALSDYQKAFYGVVLINRWFSIRIPLISSLLSLTAAVGVILMGRYGAITEGIAGMAIVYAFRFWDSLNWTVRAFGEAEAQMTSVERLEALSQLKPECTLEAASNHPIKGDIRFQNVFARYAPHLPDVLKDADFSIPAGSKVGVVGRTGAGKSTLFSLLHRFIQCQEGSITIDNIDIKLLPVSFLRQSIGTIPQNPVLFAGTIRQNLDPLNYYSDDQLHLILRKAHIDFLREGLSTKVSEGGSNFSRGQKQLLCLARALVRQSQIIIVDEATASVDAKTDALIRQILMHDCPEVTVLIIAHKLQSVSECDMIIEMRDGKVLETTYRNEVALSA